MVTTIRDLCIAVSSKVTSLIIIVNSGIPQFSAFKNYLIMSKIHSTPLIIIHHGHCKEEGAHQDGNAYGLRTGD